MVEFEVDERRVAFRVLVACAIVELTLVFLDYHITYRDVLGLGPLRRLFNMELEDGLPSWVAVTQTSFVALTLWAIFAVRRKQRGAWAWGWVVIALFFSYMAMDDGSKMHERIGTSVRVLQEAGDPTDAGAQAFSLFPSYSWQVVFLPVFGSIGLFIFFFLWHELGAVDLRLAVVAALGCLVVAVGLDFIEGLEPGHAWNVHSWITDWGGHSMNAWSLKSFQEPAFEAVVHFSKSIEECLEMFGNSLFWFVFLRHLGGVGQDVRVRFSGASA